MNSLQIIEQSQTRSASTKHSARLLVENKDTQTIDLCTLNLSGSCMRNPVGLFRLHSVQRLQYPESMKKKDILRIVFYTSIEAEPVSLDFPIEALNSPKKIIAGLQGVGVAFSSTLSNSDFAKLFADFLARKMEIRKIAALPGWTHFPSDEDPFTFLLPDKIPNTLTAEPLSNLKVNMNPDLDIECIMQKFTFDQLRNCPVEINILFLIRHYSLLRTLYKEIGREIHSIVNIILDGNDIKSQNLLVNFLSLYKNTKIHTLPIPQTKLKELITLHKDDMIFFNVPSHQLSHYSRELLNSNIESLLYLQQEGSFTPLLFSSGLMNGINRENILTLSITEDILETLSSKDFKSLGNFSIGFIDFVEKNLERLRPHFKKAECEVKKSYDDIQNILLSVHSIFLSFSSMYWDKVFGALNCASGKIRKKLRKYFTELEISSNIVGLAEQFLQALQKEILAGTVKVQSSQAAWNPDTMAKNTVLTDGLHLLIPPKLFSLLVEQTFSQVTRHNVLESLETDGYLIADNSTSKHCTKYYGYIGMNGKRHYSRFVVLYSSNINFTYGPRLV